MIGAAFDDSGGAQARLSLEHLFLAAGVVPAFVGFRAHCAIGGSDDPLVRSAHRAAVDGVVLGGDELPPFEGTSEEFVFRSTCSMVAAADGSLLLARGPFGGRALYYSISDGGRRVLACSRLAPLVACLDAIPRINVERLAVLLLAEHVGDVSTTPYADVFRVQPCEKLRFEGRSPVRRRHIPPMPPLREDSAEDLALELVERLSSTVARSIAPFPKVAIMAGGGLDSAGLLAITMKQRRDSEIFAIDYAEFNNDRPHLRTLAKHFKLVPKVIRAADTASLLPAGLVVDGAPFGWPTAQFEVALGLKARQAGAEAIITGMGGDDVFDGDLGIFGRGEGVVGRGKSLWDAARLRVTWSSTPFSRIRGLVLKPWFESLAPPPVREAWRRSRVRPWVWAGPKLREILELPAGRTSLGWFADLAVFGALADAADYRGQFELAAGLTRLDPYLDANIVEFVASIPPNMMFHDRRIRGFFRLAMKGHLPDTVRLRPDKAWLDPAFVELYSMIRNNDEIAELSRMEALADLGLVNPAGVRKALADAEAQQDVPAWLSVLLGEEAFVREHSRLKLFDAERGRVEVARA